MLWEALWVTGWLVELSGNASKVQRRTKELLCSYVTIQYFAGLYTLAARITEHKRTQPLLNTCPSLWRTGFLLERALDWVFAIYLFASFSKLVSCYLHSTDGKMEITWFLCGVIWSPQLKYKSILRYISTA